jgi:hypothetical protein
MNAKVIVHVTGGVADVAYATPGITAVVLDFDNYHNGNEPISDMGSENNGHLCPICQRGNSEFEWNAATLYKNDNDPNLTPIQAEVNPESMFTCCFCFEESPLCDIKKR